MKKKTIVKRLSGRRGEAYVDLALAVFLFAFCLLFFLSVASLTAKSQELHTVADRLSSKAAEQGHTGVDEYAEELQDIYGIPFSWDFEGTEYWSEDRVQLGDKIVCRVSAELPLLGSALPVTLQAVSVAQSEVYYKE